MLSITDRGFDRGLYSGFSSVVVGLPNLERTHQNCADEHEGCKCREDIQSQSKVHERPPLWLLCANFNKTTGRPKLTNDAAPPHNCPHERPFTLSNMLISMD